MARPKPPAHMITCPDLYGHDHEFAPESIRFRPAAYGVLCHNHQVLLSQSRFSEKWDLPGGGIEPWETLADGLAREFLEETGITVSVQRFLEMQENFIAFFSHPYHSLRFYYTVKLLAPDVTLAPDAHELLDLRWWPIEALPAGHMNDYEVRIIQMACQEPE
ncbi:MAG: NUDIX hydrolase [Sulfobacillus thermosulfidooxidans]|nr:NUDIX domain-containing protein [Sulfobacillus thermotolerans]PSR37765.1 MAG: NUDIX hydrolase [Sulfobacillus thermosulfidooxidans]